MSKCLNMKCFITRVEESKCISSLKRDNEMASNYRPVSLPSVVCKIIEKCVRDHVSQLLRKL